LGVLMIRQRGHDPSRVHASPALNWAEIIGQIDHSETAAIAGESDYGSETII
jgi:hypothetical protein